MTTAKLNLRIRILVIGALMFIAGSRTQGAIGWPTNEYRIAENDKLLVLRVCRSDPTGEFTATVRVVAEGATAIEGMDFRIRDHRFTFLDGETHSSAIAIDVDHDPVIEPEESFTLEIVGGTHALKQFSSTTVRIANSGGEVRPEDVTTYFGGPIVQTWESTGSSTYGIYIYRSHLVAGTVGVESIPGSAGVADFNLPTNRIGWTIGETSLRKTYFVHIVNDEIEEASESFDLQLTEPQGFMLSEQSGTRVLVGASDHAFPQPEIAFDFFTHVEEDWGNAFIRVVSQGGDGPISVEYFTADHTAIAGEDYVATNGVLTWPTGRGTQFIQVPLLDDTIYDPSESFRVHLTNAHGAVISGFNFKYFTITDSGNLPTIPGSIGWAPQELFSVEGATLTLQLCRTGSSNHLTGTLSHRPSTNASHADYVLMTNRFEFLPGELQSQPITLHLSSDGVAEPLETIGVSFDLDQPVEVIKNRQLLVHIADHPLGSVSTVQFGQTNYVFGEREEFVHLEVERLGADGVVILEFDVPSTIWGRSHDVDWISTNLVWLDGDDSSKLISMRINDDAIDEWDWNDEFTLPLGTVHGAMAGSNDTTFLKLLDDDPVRDTVGFTRPVYRVSEAVGMVVVGIQRAFLDVHGRVKIRVRPNTADDLFDFVSLEKEVEWTRQDAGHVKHVEIPILSDWRIEGAEHFDLDIVAGVEARSLVPGSNATATVLIEDDDQFHPADTSQDWRLSLAEVDAYGTAWRNFQRGAQGTDIPIDYLTAAACLWRQGEQYRLDLNADPPWVPEITNSPVAGNSLIEIDMPRAYQSGRELPVTISVTPATGTHGWAGEESIPAGWLATNVAVSGIFDTASGRIRWGPFLDEVPRTLTYQILPMGTNTVMISGRHSLDGSSIVRERVLVLGAWMSAARQSNDGFEFRWQGLIGRDSVAEYSEDLIRWIPLPGNGITVGNGISKLIDSSSVGRPKRFYRIRQPE